MTVPRLNWKANLICYKGGEKGHLTQECPHTGSSAVAQRQQTLIVNTHQTSCADPTLFPAQTITAETPITADIWQSLMEQLHKVNQDSKLLKKACKRKVQQNQAVTCQT